ncbi:MAG TPA: hypothetical protein VLB75_03635 [Steroidobacteraceae bacterium]|nr:hypothetical protein [Steroidobacteraceae bacterium]
MTRFKPVAALLALAYAFSSPGEAADKVAALQAELQALKSDYAARITALEARLSELESAATAAAAVEPAPLPPPPAMSADTRASPAAFNPSLSVILGGTYTSASEDPESWQIAGFIPGDAEVGPGERSFNLGESELTIGANVDPYFSAQLTAAITGEDEIEVEEAYFRTLALPAGFTAKGGRFFSGLGYLNEVHAHAWDFADQPLVYQAFFGNQLAQDGAQLKWLAPTDLFIELGAETGNGQAFPGTRRNRNGLNGATVFAHVGGDIGDSSSWRAGASYLDQRAEERTYEDVDDVGTPVVNAFTGKSSTWGIDGVLKWAPHGNSARQQLKIQGEYMHRKEEGDLTFDVGGRGLNDAYRSEQSGWYLQSVFQFRPRWRVGVRYDALDSGTPDVALVESGLLPAEAFPILLPAEPDRITVMVDWNPTEFSRLRAQYAWDDARATDDRDRQFFLQYLFGIGAHGAHKF